MATFPQHPAPEAILMRRARSGDKEAFYALVRPHERAVYVAARCIVENDADAEEVAQQAVLKAFLKLPRFRGDRAFGTWLIETTTKEARSRVRQQSPVDRSGLNGEAQYVPRALPQWQWIPVQALEKKEMRQATTRALLSLAAKYRQVFVLRDMQKLSTAETAKIVGISEDEVKQRLLSARLQMRDAIAACADSMQAASGKAG